MDIVLLKDLLLNANTAFSAMSLVFAELMVILPSLRLLCAISVIAVWLKWIGAALNYDDE